VNITGGVFQFPQNRCICHTCGFHCFTEERMGKVVASHPTHPHCPHSHKAFEVPVTVCQELPPEFFSEQIV
jgi:hypothetical protein